MATAMEIGQAGEGAVVKWLKANGYKIDLWDTQSPGSTDIEASGTSHVIVQVKSALSPNIPGFLSDSEKSAFVSRAAKIGALAWAAQVQVDSRLQQVGDIKWTKLN